ncbi:MAG: transglycosylase SLT domain-containing protein [Solirubrobacteraceae bacterium]
MTRKTASVRFRATAGVLLGLAVILVIVLGARSSPPLPPLPGAMSAASPPPGDPLIYRPDREAEFVARAAAGAAHPLYVKSPGGIVATAARVARFRGLINRVTAGTTIAPRTLEGLVLLESAGDPQAIAGGDPAGAAGLTQIVASTGRSLLAMRINLAASRRLTAQIDAAASNGRRDRVAQLEHQRARIDERFDPQKALTAAIRYLELAQRAFGRADLAVESYHMGMGNLRRVLASYDGGTPVPYAQLYFDSAPDRHAAAYALLSSFGDDSWTYLWRVTAAEQIMQRYRTDRSGLGRTAELQIAAGSAAQVLHPPNQTPTFSTPAALDRAYADHQIVPLPANPSMLGLAYARGLGATAHRFGFPAALYRGLRPEARAVLIWLASRVKALSGTAPLTLTSAVADDRLEQFFGYSDPPAAAGWSFTIRRHYVDGRQAAAFQAVLDRLQALNLIAWQRFPSEIEITVAGDAASILAHGV